MSKKQVNFNLGSRGLTAEESAVVESAKDLFRSSLERHGKSVAGHDVFATKSSATAAPKAAAKPPPSKPTDKTLDSGSATWTSNRVAATSRKY
ncbi:hypothetical protein [Janthinobacterium lividum]|uniref:hypothetical protein n=1 Tax=Janthinobacterium lividum TaxID=29581 RepID=UPI001407282F|nr:hypothetical protein [Janthinobacterium lividum]NHQ94283.1 hypothetical protein [Janthinobacterium lividum]